MSRGSCWTRTIRDVVAEIETMGRRVAFIDSSITEFTAYAEKLWRELIPLNIRWYSSATVRFAEDERAVRLAAKSGCRGVLIGFESVNQAALGGAGKSFNNVRRYREAIQRLHDCGIMILGCFVFGFDEDDQSVFERTVEFVTSAGIDLVRYAILTPFPGTPWHEKFRQEQRIVTQDWSLYDTENAVFKPAGMSARQLEEGWKWAYRETYRFSSMRKRVLRKGSPLLLSVPANLLFRTFAREFNAAVSLQ
jgi:radical SAM superfamily enzyme YgiQ (UPF0313 family)